ncbi:MAG: ribonucleoside-diphosphate reductase, adenosylcobalamin-dependent, partial [Alphaproteobacteria bacterium]|nr:ribonucleoside-diphosphate reductase, adenosylcobalamin-dependent [Alphaproteobacteria bacterium]
MTADVDTFALQIWNDKYRFRAADGSPIDQSLDGTFRRVAKALAVNEADAPAWEDRFYKVMHAGVAYPAGRILSGAGTGRSVTLFNCLIADRIGDSMVDIMRVVTETTLTMRMGGGVGHDFSTLRPAGALVNGVGSKSSGPVSFMDIFDAACKTVSSAGERRGAMMGTMRID